MNAAELIDELTNICIAQADIIRDQAFALGQLGAKIREEDAAEEEIRLRDLVDKDFGDGDVDS